MDLWFEIVLTIIASFALLTLIAISRWIEVAAAEITALRILVQGEAEIGLAEQAQRN